MQADAGATCTHLPRMVGALRRGCAEHSGVATSSRVLRQHAQQMHRLKCR